MKGVGILTAFLLGGAVGAAMGLLFAPEKGEDTRKKIADFLRKKGVKLDDSELSQLVDEIEAGLKKD